MHDVGGVVPSKANPADIPTRESRRGDMPETARWVGRKLPSIEEIEGDTAGGIRMVRAQEGANT